MHSLCFEALRSKCKKCNCRRDEKQIKSIRKIEEPERQTETERGREGEGERQRVC